jgi:hypothetical protein
MYLNMYILNERFELLYHRPLQKTLVRGGEIRKVRYIDVYPVGSRRDITFALLVPLSTLHIHPQLQTQFSYVAQYPRTYIDHT